jgi:hypothetical protein
MTEFDEEFIVSGNWTAGQKNHIDKFLSKIKSVLKDRFPEIVDDLDLSCEYPEKGIGAKLVAKWSAKDYKYLGELNNLHFMEELNQDNPETRRMLSAFVNDHAVLLYEQAIHKLLARSLKTFLKRVEEENLFKEIKELTDLKVVPTYEVPKDVVLMHPDTFEGFSRGKGGADEESEA